MTMKAKSIFGLAMMAMLGIQMTSCSSDSDVIEDHPKEMAYVPVKAPEFSVTSGNGIFAAITRADDDNQFHYYKVQDYKNTTPEHMPALYAKYYDKVPAAVTDAEKAFVINYIKEHPNEGGVEFNYVNYFIQNIGSSYDRYYTEDWNHAKHNMVGGEQMDFFEVNGHHINDYNAVGGPDALCLNLPVNNPAYHDSYGDTDNMKYNSYKFYSITYNGAENYYLCFDYKTHKNSGNEDHPGDGVYNDWVIKLVPADGNSKDVPTEDDPEKPGVKVADAHIEVNMSINDEHEKGDWIHSKTSIHVRDTSDVHIVIPVPAEYYLPADDMAIVEKHYADMVYKESGNSVTMNINGNNVTITTTYKQDCIDIQTSGINATVLKYCRENFGDGLTFEVFNYYQNTKRSELQNLLNQSTVAFTNNTRKYINAFGKIGGENPYANPLDCTVRPKDNNYKPSTDEGYNKVYRINK